MAKRSPRQTLEGIKDAILAIEEFTVAKTYGDFLGVRMLRQAIERNVEIISIHPLKTAVLAMIAEVEKAQGST